MAQERTAQSVLTREEMETSLQSTANASLEMCQQMGIDAREMVTQGQWMMNYFHDLYNTNRPQFMLMANDMLRACPGLLVFFQTFPGIQAALQPNTRIPVLYFTSHPSIN